MANLIKLSNDLEYVPKEQLIQMSQNPDSTYPSYLVLAEIQRRTQNEKAYAAQQPQPETTVAEEVVQEYASSPQGLGAMTQPSGGNLSTPGAESNMAPPSPMQMMASGGRTGYQVGGSLGIVGDSLSDTFINPMTPKNISNEEKEEVDKNFGQLAKQYGAQGLKAIGALNEDGSINYVNSALALASINPAFRLTKGAVGLAGAGLQKYAPGLLQGAKNLVTKPNPALASGLKVGQRKVIDPTAKTSKMIDIKSGKVIPERVTNLKGLARGAGSLALPSLVIGNLLESGAERKLLKAEEAKLAAEQDAIRKKELQEELQLAEEERKAEEEAKRLKKEQENKNRKRADMLVGLGGAIGSAKNLGELSSGVSDAYFNVQNKQDANKLAGLQGRMAELQIEKAETELANMPEQRLIQQYGFIQDAIDDHNSGESVLDEVTLAKYINQKSLLLEQIMAYGNVNLSGSQTSAMAEAKIT